MGDKHHEELVRVSLSAHKDEWKRISHEYLNSSTVQTNSDPLYFRHRSIEGLLSGKTNDYKRKD